MKVTVKLFAAARETAGTDQLALEVPDAATIANVRRALGGAVPELEPVIAHSLFAIDAEYANETTVVRENSEIALIPPVSGG